ncbi:MAG: hypothetical protein V2I54_10445 [Bacteroidales bacterium]|jgi:hypothetical protein|nr:hypothetical protein [Bacteroidales bacterium]
MANYQLETVFNSTYPVDCYILQGRLESEGVDCFIFDDEIVSVNPFKSVAVGGVKLKVPSNQTKKAKLILEKLENNLLFDEAGDYHTNEALKKAFEKQNIVLKFHYLVLNNPSLLNDTLKQNEILKPELFSNKEVLEIVGSIGEYLKNSKLKFKFTWKQFFYELFDFEREFFKYLRVKPNSFHLEKDILNKFSNNRESKNKHSIICPNCKSDNVKFGYAIDYKYDIAYLILSLLFMAPFLPFRKKNHCFECGHNFR